MYKNFRTVVNLSSYVKLKRFTHNVNTTGPKPVHCLCGGLYSGRQTKEANMLVEIIRIHSTASDQHRQKAVIDTTTPKIDIGKTIDKNALGTIELWKFRLDPYVKLARWDKPIGIYLLFWPCSWSIALASIAGAVPPEETARVTALFLVGATLMRGAGCTINDMWDRDVDAQVSRTRDRPLASGAVSPRQALAFLGAQLTLALAVLLQLNCYSVLLGASSMVLVVTYPLAKRFTNYPQLVLGATFNWGALLGYSAIQGALLPAVCLPLYAGSLAWTVIYDTIYAHQDKEDDARIGMKSTALTFGAHTKPALALALCVSAGCFLQAGGAAGLHWPYHAGVAAYAVHAARQIYTLDPNSPDDCAKKFKSNSLVGLIILLGILAGGYSQYRENLAANGGRGRSDATRSCVFG